MQKYMKYDHLHNFMHSITMTSKPITRWYEALFQKNKQTSAFKYLNAVMKAG